MTILSRRPYRFTSADTTTIFTFPDVDVEWEATQPLRAPLVVAVGAHYAYDYRGGGVGLKDVASERLRFSILRYPGSPDPDTVLDELKSECWTIGLGKLWSTDEAGAALRWSWARLAAMPTITFTAENLLNLMVRVEFLRFSDWYASADLAEDETGIVASPHAFTVNNPGNAPIYNAVFRFRSNSAAGWSNLKLTNSTTGPNDESGGIIESLRDAASALDELKFDCGAGTVEYSTDDGATYADDYANYVRQASQVGMIILWPGNNSLSAECGGTPNYDLEIEAPAGAWH